MKTVALILSILIGGQALAYIPKLRTIIKNVSETRSDKSYLLTRELLFKGEAEKYVVVEKWYIKDDSNIYLEATAPSFKYSALFKDGKRYRLNDAGQVVAKDTDPNFYMKAFLSADPNTIGKYLVSLGVAPSKILDKQEPVFDLEQVNYEPEEGVRLTRLSGLVTYGIGSPMPKDSNTPTKHVWIIQDRFLVAKIRGEGQVVEAKDYKQFKGRFWFPKKISVKWQDIDVEAATINLEPITVGPVTKKKFEFDYLKESVNNQNSATVNEQLAKIETFYKLFR